MYPKESYKIIVHDNYSPLGDTITTLPIVRALERDGCLHQLLAPVHHVNLYKQVIPEHKIICIETDLVDKPLKKHEEVMVPFDAEYPVISTWRENENFFPDKMHLVDYFSIKLGKCVLLPEEKNYPILQPKSNIVQEYNLPKKYFVVHTPYLQANKALSQKTIYKILHHIKKLGYTPILTGAYGDKYEFKEYKDGKYNTTPKGLDEVPDFVIDMRNKTPEILDLHAIIHYSYGFLGMDGGAVHVAGMTRVPIIAGFTFQRPEYLMPIRYNEVGWNVMPIVPPEGTCRFCLSNRLYPIWKFKHMNNFDCMKGTDECSSNLSAKDFLNALDKVLK
jgi:hypothetical protein